MEEAFSRTAQLLGEEATERLKQAKVCLFGVGGVGSYTAEALARAGIGKLVLVDPDRVNPSNINRQLVALHSTVGQPKVQVMKERILDINPEAQVEAIELFYLPGEDTTMLQGCDYVVDAIDTVAAKVSLVKECHDRSIPLISAMGCGNKLDPTRFQVADLFTTSVCPLCRKMRSEVKRLGIDRLKVVYSQETPVIARGENLPVGSVSFVPSVAGLILAGEVVKDLSLTK